MRSIRWMCVALGLTACASGPVRQLRLSGTGRTLPELFLGGWDGHRLIAFDDRTVQVGVTRGGDLSGLLRAVGGTDHALLWVEKAGIAQLTGAAGAFCEAPACYLVAARSGARLERVLAVFEMESADPDARVQGIYLAEQAVRPPGPRKWLPRCAVSQTKPRAVHPEGAALFPAVESGGVSFAAFGWNSERMAPWMDDGRVPLPDGDCPAPPPSEAVIEEPVIRADPTLLGAPPVDPKPTATPPAPTKRRKSSPK